MLDRLSGDGSQKEASFEGFEGSESFKVVETLKHCHLETLPSIYLRMPSLVMTVL